VVVGEGGGGGGGGWGWGGGGGCHLCSRVEEDWFCFTLGGGLTLGGGSGGIRGVFVTVWCPGWGQGSHCFGTL